VQPVSAASRMHDQSAVQMQDRRMAMLFWTIVILLVILTGALIPILHFGLWALLAVLVVVLLVWVFVRLCGLVLRPFVLLGSDVAQAVRGGDYPKPSDPDYKHYLDWTNRTGEFAGYKEWTHVKSTLAERRTSDASREALFRRIEQREKRESRYTKLFAGRAKRADGD
jgi:hypothetical protein